MLRRLDPLATENVTLAHAAGRVCAEPIRTDRPSPPADVSAMDGYALRLSDATQAEGGRLPVAGTILAGQPSQPLERGKAMRIMTGAVVPPGAEAVIRREDTDEGEGWVVLHNAAAIKPGQSIRRRGENGAANEPVLEAGHPVTPAVATALASFGSGRLAVRKRVRVGLIITGDELLEPGEPAADWQIRDSNGPALRTLLHGLPWVNCQRSERAADDRNALMQAVIDALHRSDALLLTGGVSMGTHDFVPEILRQAGCELVFHKLPIRPGKPLLGAIGPRGQLVVGLPGNPMSVMVTARLIGIPLLRKLAGWRHPIQHQPVVRLREYNDSKVISLWLHRPVRVIGDGLAELVPTRGSGDVVSIAKSDGFVQLPPNAGGEGPWPFYRWEVSC